jgi:hypothetical protein
MMSFPMIGKKRRDFSKHWKKGARLFQSLEKTAARA